MKKIVMLCSALVLGVWSEAQASLWEIEAFTKEKETGVTSKTSLVAITERMNKLNSVSTVDAKRVYRWLYDYWLSDTTKWSNDGKKSTFGNIQGYCNKEYIVDTEDEIITTENDKKVYTEDWTTNFNLMLKKIENLLPTAAANNGVEIEDEKPQEQKDQDAAAEAAQEIHAGNLKTDYGNKVIWDYTFKTDTFQPDGHDGYIVKDDITGDPILNKKGSKRIESEQLAQKQANKEEIAKTLLAQEQALETGKQTTVATLKSLRIVDKDGKISADETSKQLYINPKADAWINYDLVNAQHEVQLATEEQRIRHALELSQVQVIENMGTAISEMEASLFEDSPNINSLTPFDLTYLSKVMGDAGVTVDDDFIVSLKRAWSMQALDMSPDGIDARVGVDDKGERTYKKVDPNVFTNADIATLLLDHFKGTNTVKKDGNWNLSIVTETGAEGKTFLNSLFSTFNSKSDEIKKETANKMKFHLNLVTRLLQEIEKEDDITSKEDTVKYEVDRIVFHAFRQYMLQAFREAFSLIKEQHKEDREDWLASLMPATKKTTDNTSGIITHEGDSKTNKTDIQWASDLTPCDATKPVAD